MNRTVNAVVTKGCICVFIFNYREENCALFSLYINKKNKLGSVFEVVTIYISSKDSGGTKKTVNATKFAALDDVYLLRFSSLCSAHYFILNMENRLFSFVARLISSLQLNHDPTVVQGP